MGPGGRPRPGEEGGICGGSEAWGSDLRSAWLAGEKPGLHHHSGYWDEGGSGELQRSGQAHRLRSSCGVDLSAPRDCGVRLKPSQKWERRGAAVFEITLAAPGRCNLAFLDARVSE